MIAADELFWAKVAKGDGCWLWTGSRNNAGYGKLTRNGRQHLAHRAAWEAVHGPVPDGLELDHLCRRRSCVRPDHLEPVTHAENMARSVHVPKSACPHGHDFTPENTYTSPQGLRFCRTCSRRRRGEHKARRTADAHAR